MTEPKDRNMDGDTFAAYLRKVDQAIEARAAAIDIYYESKGRQWAIAAFNCNYDPEAAAYEWLQRQLGGGIEMVKTGDLFFRDAQSGDEILVEWERAEEARACLTCYDEHKASCALNRQQLLELAAHILIGVLDADGGGYTTHEVASCDIECLIGGFGDALMKAAAEVLPEN